MSLSFPRPPARVRRLSLGPVRRMTRGGPERKGKPNPPQQRPTSLLGGPSQLLTDIPEHRGSIFVFARRDGQHLGFVFGMLRNDDHRGRPRALDVELDPAQPLKRDGEGQAILRRDDDAAVSYGED